MFLLCFRFHLQTIMKLLVDRNSLHLGSLMHSCISAIEWCQHSSLTPEPERISIREKVPHMEENAWMLLSLLSKVFLRAVASYRVVLSANECGVREAAAAAFAGEHGRIESRCARQVFNSNGDERGGSIRQRVRWSN